MYKKKQKKNLITNHENFRYNNNHDVSHMNNKLLKMTTINQLLILSDRSESTRLHPHLSDRTC